MDALVHLILSSSLVCRCLQQVQACPRCFAQATVCFHCHSFFHLNLNNTPRTVVASRLFVTHLMFCRMLLRGCLLAVSAIAVAASSAKRGFVGNGCKGSACEDANLLDKCAWYYSYNAEPNYNVTNGDVAPSFVPMFWCLKDEGAIPSYVNTSFLLGYNEPNDAGQCNTSPKDAAVAWSTRMKLFPNTQFVSPATAGNGIPWLTQFIGNCSSLYGPSGCRLSYIAVHYYSCTPSSTMAYLKSVYDAFKLPVWLTEFSCGDGAEGKPTADQIKFMKEIVPLLEEAPYVYRYAWMAVEDSKGLRDLVTSSSPQQLTELGQLYNSL